MTERRLWCALSKPLRQFLGLNSAEGRRRLPKGLPRWPVAGLAALMALLAWGPAATANGKGGPPLITRPQQRKDGRWTQGLKQRLRRLIKPVPGQLVLKASRELSVGQRVATPFVAKRRGARESSLLELRGHSEPTLRHQFRVKGSPLALLLLTEAGAAGESLDLLLVNLRDKRIAERVTLGGDLLTAGWLEQLSVRGGELAFRYGGQAWSAKLLAQPRRSLQLSWPFSPKTQEPASPFAARQLFVEPVAGTKK